MINIGEIYVYVFMGIEDNIFFLDYFLKLFVCLWFFNLNDFCNVW